jgi:hypothetical protein
MATPPLDSTSMELSSTTTPDFTDPSTEVYSWVGTCTYETCGLNGSYWNYRPNKAINLAFAIVFGLSALVFLTQGFASKKTWLGFSIAMVCGCVLEAIGYIGRLLARDDVFSQVRYYSLLLPCHIYLVRRIETDVHIDVEPLPNPNHLSNNRPRLPRSRNLPLSLTYSNHIRRLQFPHRSLFLPAYLRHMRYRKLDSASCGRRHRVGQNAESRGSEDGE